jgi:hypothetical protein
MFANAIDALKPWIGAGEALTIVSFDVSGDEAAREIQEERSLNLALRRRRVRSEVLRIPLQASAATKSFLADVIAALAGRRLLILARELPQYPDTLELMMHLCDLAKEAIVFVIGPGGDAITHPSASVYLLESDDHERIEMVADALILTQAG